MRCICRGAHVMVSHSSAITTMPSTAHAMNHSSPLMIRALAPPMLVVKGILERSKPLTITLAPCESATERHDSYLPTDEPPTRVVAQTGWNVILHSRQCFCCLLLQSTSSPTIPMPVTRPVYVQQPEQFFEENSPKSKSNEFEEVPSSPLPPKKKSNVRLLH